jgi:thiol-disulfide isomerase/thioredoxin
MVSNYAMKYLRYFVPILGICALVALFLKLPESAKFFNLLSCPTCSASDPYLPLFGAAYFAALIAISLLFPSFPGPRVARSGLIWAFLLALVLTYIDFPHICTLCLIGHSCNILIWAIWVVAPPRNRGISSSSVRERLCLLLFVPVSVVALFSCLNLTFMAYSFKNMPGIAVPSLKIGDPAPAFTVQTSAGGMFATIDTNSKMIVNFISLDCPHCEEQLLSLSPIIPQIKEKACRFVNIAPLLPKDVLQYLPGIEWVEDKSGKLRELFRVTGYPTLFVIGADSKIIQIIPGVDENLKSLVLASLSK